jgi:hypothetical protein
MKIPAAETDIIDRGYRCRSRHAFPAKSVALLTPCGHRSKKNHILLCSEGVKTKFETLNTVEKNYSQTEKMLKNPFKYIGGNPSAKAVSGIRYSHSHSNS